MARVGNSEECHGIDGRGKLKGGIISSDLTWDASTKPNLKDAGFGRFF
jgi:hypothetical protein